MPTGPKAFLGLPDASGLQPCNWTHLIKMTFCHTCMLGGAYNKYQFSASLSSCGSVLFFVFNHPGFELLRDTPTAWLGSPLSISNNSLPSRLTQPLNHRWPMSYNQLLTTDFVFSLWPTVSTEYMGFWLPEKKISHFNHPVFKRSDSCLLTSDY